MKAILLCTLMFAALIATAAKPYDFRSSPAYGQLSATDRQRLEQVHRDLVLLWGALDMYSGDHNDEPPETLEALVPKYLAELPADPFATQQTAGEPMTHGYTSSKGGLGYRLKQGSAGNRAWVISSVGLPKFPYLSASGNVGLYRCKGTWLSGINPALTK